MSASHVLLEILDERLRQIIELDHTPERDDTLTAKQLAIGAAHLALTHTYAFVRDGFDKTPAVNWPWGPPQGQGSSHRTNCIRAITMLWAEVERLDRATGKEAQAATADYIAHATGTHGSPELDEDATKLRALGQDPGPTIEDAYKPQQ